MSKAKAEQARERIPYSPGYLITVLLGAAVNIFVFYLLSGHLENANFPLSSKGILSVLLGILYAGGCNLSAMAVVRRLRRRNLADRILSFCLIDIAGMTIFALAAPYLVVGN